MEQITLIYLENSDADYRKSCKKAIKQISEQSDLVEFILLLIMFQLLFSF